MIKLHIDRDKIKFARMIEGRKFKEGFWYFPESSLEKLRDLGLVHNDKNLNKTKEFINYPVSEFLRSYQKDIVLNSLNNKSFGIFADTGLGKTIIGLEIANNFNKSLIVCPLNIINTAWIEDCNKFYPNKKIVSLWDKNKNNRIKTLNEEADIYVINFEGIKLIYNELTNKNFDCCIIDESSKMRNLKSQVTSSLLNLKENIDRRYILSGCPTPNHNSEIFPQMKFINEDIFGINYYGFLAKYFSQDMKNPHRWFQTDENKEKYFDRLREQSIFIKKEDCIELPEKTFMTRVFNLSTEQQLIYDNFIQDIKDNINVWSKFEFTAKLMKLRQITSGFIIGKDKRISEFKDNKKVELSNIFDELGDKQSITWCQFNYEINDLASKFNGVGLTSKTSNRDQIIKDFKSGKIKRLFVHPKLLGMGVTFTNCSYNIYYSLSFSYEEFKQSQDRIHRIGQVNKCTYIILQAENTIDEKIYKCLQRKKNAVDELYLELGLKSQLPATLKGTGFLADFYK